MHCTLWSIKQRNILNDLHRILRLFSSSPRNEISWQMDRWTIQHYLFAIYTIPCPTTMPFLRTDPRFARSFSNKLSESIFPYLVELGKIILFFFSSEDKGGQGPLSPWKFHWGNDLDRERRKWRSFVFSDARWNMPDKCSWQMDVVVHVDQTRSRNRGEINRKLSKIFRVNKGAYWKTICKTRKQAWKHKRL